MVYKINELDLINIDHSTTYVITLSADGMFALVSSSLNDLGDIEIISQISDSDLAGVLDQSEWKQPCTNC